MKPITCKDPDCVLLSTHVGTCLKGSEYGIGATAYLPWDDEGHLPSKCRRANCMCKIALAKKVQHKKIVRRVAQVAFWLGLIGLFLWANHATTPAQCRVAIEHMSPYCKDLLFPH